MDEKNIMNEILLAIVNLNNKMDNLTGELKEESKRIRAEIKELREEMDTKFKNMEEKIDKRFDESYAQMLEYFEAGSRAHTKLEKRVKELERKIG